MAGLLETKISSVDKASVIFAPEDISEQTQVSGFAFSRRARMQTNLKDSDFSPPFARAPRSSRMRPWLTNWLRMATVALPLE